MIHFHSVSAERVTLPLNKVKLYVSQTQSPPSSLFTASRVVDVIQRGRGVVCMCDGGLCEQREVGGEGWREGGTWRSISHGPTAAVFSAEEEEGGPCGVRQCVRSRLGESTDPLARTDKGSCLSSPPFDRFFTVLRCSSYPCFTRSTEKEGRGLRGGEQSGKNYPPILHAQPVS